MTEIKKKKPYYIDNKDFLITVVDFKKSGFKDEKLKAKLGDLFLKIANRLVYSIKFVNYPQEVKDDLTGDAIFMMINKVQFFDEEKSTNPFAYFTEITYNCFKMYLKNMYKDKEHVIVLDFVDRLEDSVDEWD